MIKKHHKLMWGFTSAFVRSLRRPVFVYLSTLALTLQAIFALFFYVAEVEINKGVVSFFDSFYFTVTVMTGVGLGDIAPVTGFGRFLAILMMLAGTAIFVTFTGVLAASILEVANEQNEKQGK
jgi:voltage-gated potassium channel